VGSPEEGAVRERGLYAIMEQAGHITSINLLELGLRELKLRHPLVEILMIQPDLSLAAHRPVHGFEASRAALRFGTRRCATG